MANKIVIFAPEQVLLEWKRQLYKHHTAKAHNYKKYAESR